MPAADPGEIDKFEQLAERWWDPEGEFKPLHRIQPLRLDYIQSVADLADKRVLDVGCGGGLLAEAMAGLGASVHGIDVTPRNIEVARTHAALSGADVRYEEVPAETLAARGAAYDVVLNMEVVEHVTDPAAYLAACQQLLKPGGLMICSTINRNAKSFAMAIVGAEYVMRWLPKGTHEWKKFITPDELYEYLRGAGLEPVDRKGFVFNPLSWSWSISARDLSVNYVTASLRPA